MLIFFMLLAVFALPDPSTLPHEEAAIHQSPSGPLEPPPPAAAALQPERSRLLLQCGAAKTDYGRL